MGRIVRLTSGGPLGFPEQVFLGAAKAALENHTMSAALELADRGITATVVSPPVTDTGWDTDQVRQAVDDSSTLFHIVRSGDVAALIARLLPDRDRLITDSVSTCSGTERNSADRGRIAPPAGGPVIARVALSRPERGGLRRELMPAW